MCLPDSYTPFVSLAEFFLRSFLFVKMATITRNLALIFLCLLHLLFKCKLGRLISYPCEFWLQFREAWWVEKAFRLTLGIYTRWVAGAYIKCSVQMAKAVAPGNKWEIFLKLMLVESQEIEMYSFSTPLSWHCRRSAVWH